MSETEKNIKSVRSVGAKLAFNHVLVTSDSPERFKQSGLITSLSSAGDREKNKAMNDVQTVIAVGPFIKEENGIGIKPGDNVLLDIDKVLAKNSRVVQVAFDKNGKYIDASVTPAELKDMEYDIYLLITDREILMNVGYEIV